MNGLPAAAIFCLFLTILFTPTSHAVQETEWKDVSRGIRSIDLHSISVSPADPDVVYAGSNNAVYITTDRGGTWSEILSFRGTGNGIHTLAADPVNPAVIYAGTAKGLYRSSDQGSNWKRIFEGIGKPENTVFAIVVDPVEPEIIYTGTAAGVFYTRDGGKTWQRGHNLPSGVIITSLSADPRTRGILYAASFRGIYKSLNSGAAWKRIYAADIDDEAVRFLAREEGGKENVLAGVTEIREISFIRKIMIDPADQDTLYAATPMGLLVTNDAGMTWKQAGRIGLVSHNIRDIEMTVTDPGHLYAATDRGVFRYSKQMERWEELYKGMVSADIRYLAFAPTVSDPVPSLWAVTKRGIYISSPLSAGRGGDAGFSLTKAIDTSATFGHEPSIAEIKEAAIEYAEVSPDKIRNWRKAAARRALLPDVRFAYDKGNDWQNSYTFYKVDGEYVKYDDVTQDRDKGWSVSLTWQLGDLIWNSAQTSIDTRSRLMVQLRDDILNEVTRLYFERRRLQIDMVMSPPTDNKAGIERELRLQELTANIDALTGSYLSKRLAR